jgi:glutathionylspermidine synthase
MPELQIIPRAQHTKPADKSKAMLDTLWTLYDQDLLSETAYRQAVSDIKKKASAVQKRLLTLERRLVAKKLGQGEITLAQATLEWADQARRLGL